MTTNCQTASSSLSNVNSPIDPALLCEELKPLLLHNLVDELPALEHQAARFLALLDNKYDHDPVFRINRLADGTIHYEGDYAWTEQQLPDPNKSTAYFRNEFPHSWSSLNLVFDRGYEVAWNLIMTEVQKRTANNDIDPATRQAVDHWITEFLVFLPEPLPRELSDDLLSNQIVTSLRSLLKKKTFALCQSLAPRPINLEDYNVVLAAESAITDVRRTNPGAAAWYFLCVSRYSSKPHKNHPGEIISEVRSDLAAKGFNLSNWKNFAALDYEFVVKNIDLKNPPDAATLLDMLAESGVTPTLSVIEYVCRDLSLLINPKLIQSPLARQNTRRLIKAAFRESEINGNDLLGQFADVRDYVVHCNQVNQPIRARTWNGYLKASMRWHREINNRELNQRRRYILERNQGYFLCWNSLLETHEANGFKFVPLTNEMELAQEAVDMANCIDHYGPQCAEGASRIFRVLQNDQAVATVEIARHTEGWRLTEARRYGNHAVTDELWEVALALAGRYGNAWRSTAEEARHWTKFWQASQQ